MWAKWVTLFSCVLVMLNPAISITDDTNSAECHPKPNDKIKNWTEEISQSLALQGHPVYAIKVRQSDNKTRDEYLAGFNTRKFLTRHKYASFRPKPFFYQQDVTNAIATKSEPFLVAGLNCDLTIQNAAMLTGVSFEMLSLRARGALAKSGNPNDYPGSYWGGMGGEAIAKLKRPEWHGTSQIPMRYSAEGFLDRKYLYKDGETEVERKFSAGALRTLLLEDNKIVRSRKITHQQVASPILRAIENHILNNHSRNEETLILSGRKFKLTVSNMDGRVGLDRPSNSELRRRESGWIGKGVQGSFFDDELFSNNAYTFTRLDAKPGEKASFSIDGLTPHLIYRYGFYQGGEYRTSPNDIIDFFQIKPSKQDPWAGCISQSP